VYLLANIEHDWLKIGTGQIGRVHQYFNAVKPGSDQPVGQGWRVLTLAVFRDESSAKLAERQVLRFWRKYLNLPQQASRTDFGAATMQLKAGGMTRHLVGGESESVRRSATREHCSEYIIHSAGGYLRAGSHRLPTTVAVPRACAGENAVRQFLKSQDRTPTPAKASGTRSRRPADPRKKSMDVFDYIWENLRDFEDAEVCWTWQGATLPPQGYGILPWNGELLVIHREVWEWVYDDDLTDRRLWNQCGTKACANPAH